MKSVRKLELRREPLAALTTDEIGRVAGQAAVTPNCTPVILTIPVARCLSEIFEVCTAS